MQKHSFPPRRVVLALMLWVLACLATVGTSRAETRAGKPVPDAIDPRWIYQVPHASTAVVFVHGLFGDAVNTWSASSSSKSFFDYLHEYPDFGSKLDIYAFGYTSKMIGSGSFDVVDAANKLDLSLSRDHVFEHENVVFVAHSMGGLVVLQELLKHPERRPTVPMVVLLATPQEGSLLAAMAGKASPNPALPNLGPVNDNTYLKNLTETWKVERSKNIYPHVLCGFEKLSTAQFSTVVDWSSASLLCDGPAVPIDGANHDTIVKPDRPTQGALELVEAGLSQYVFQPVSETDLQMPDFLTEGDGYRIEVPTPNSQVKAKLINNGRGNVRYTLGVVTPPYLHISPEDTPRDIALGGRGEVGILVLFGATSSDYYFTIQVGQRAPKKIHVHIMNMPAVKAKQLALMDDVTGNLASYLADPVHKQQLTSLSLSDGSAAQQLVNVVQKTVEAKYPDLEPAEQYVLAASVLDAKNWPQLSEYALKTAKLIDPVNFATGRQNRTLSMTKIPTPNPSDQSLATALQSIPALRVYGYSLQGDFSFASGDYSAADRAYSAAEKLGYPVVTPNRLQALQFQQGPLEQIFRQ